MSDADGSLGTLRLALITQETSNVLVFVCSSQFHLSHPDKELLEREDRRESQQEILRRLTKDLPIYTRTMSGGGHM